MAIGIRLNSSCNTLLAVAMMLALPDSALAQWKPLSWDFGDLNRDGYEDVVVGDDAPTGHRWGELHAISGRDGSCLWKVRGTPDQDCVGVAVAVISRGVSQPLVVSASRDLLRAELRIDVHRGATGEALGSHELPGVTPSNSERLCFLAPLDDLDGDGVPEIGVGRPHYGETPRSGTSRVPGAVSVISLRDGCELLCVDGAARFEGLGYGLASGEFDDVPGLDLAVQAIRDGQWSLVWLAVPRMTELRCTAMAPSTDAWVRPDYSRRCDWNGDGFDDLWVTICHQPAEEHTASGEARAYSVVSDDPVGSVSPWGLEDPDKFGAFAFAGSSPSERWIALGTPWEDWSAGVWRVLDSSGVVASRREEGLNSYYGTYLAAVRGRESTPRLLVVRELETEPCPGTSWLRVEVECWGGDRWDSLLWVYELEPGETKVRR
ncbi:MAG: hypothetical protein IT453_04685 [Planctomycetes bacterium]|nr:hypothetical protein [Planctomycetota bacterium]